MYEVPAALVIVHGLIGMPRRMLDVIGECLKATEIPGTVFCTQRALVLAAEGNRR